MKRAVFIDSSAFIATLDRRDARHAALKALFTGDLPPLMTSLHVVGETHAWLLHRQGEDAARAFLDFVNQVKGLGLLGADDILHREVLRKLDLHRGRKLTYVDAATLAYLSRHGVPTVWGCDLDLGIEGARVVPGP